VLNKGNSNSKYGLNIFTTCYTPTHIITYPNGDPNDFRDIKEINYTKSKVSFYKDYNNKCCIDIYDDKSNPNKCRIIGQNGQTILYTDKNYSFDMYEVSQESNSFFDNKPRLIYVNLYGLYIVSKKENTIENYIKNNKFEGEVIEVSSLDGQRKVSGFDKSKEIFIFNCPSNTPLLFKIEPTPIMKQIEEITSVKLVTPPPSNQSALQRMADIFNIPVELLFIKNEKIYFIPPRKMIPIFSRTKNYDTNSYTLKPDVINHWNNYKDKLEKFIPLANCDDNKSLAKACSIMQSQEIKPYILPNKNFCRNIALKPWPKIEKYDPVLKQIEKISGVKPKTYPPNDESVLNRVSELLLDIPTDLLLIMDGRVYLKYICLKKCFGYYNTSEINMSKWIKFIDKIKSIIPPISYKFYENQLYIFNNKWFNNEWFNNENYFDDSEEAKKRLKEIALKPWDN